MALKKCFICGRNYMIVWVNVVLNRTVVDSNSHCDNVCGSHLQSKKNSTKKVLTLTMTTTQFVHKSVCSSVTVNNSPI